VLIQTNTTDAADNSTYTAIATTTRINATATATAMLLLFPILIKLI